MAKILLIRALSALFLLTGGVCLAQTGGPSANAPEASPAPLPPAVQSRLNGAALKPIPGAKPAEGVKIPAPVVPDTPPQTKMITHQ